MENTNFLSFHDFIISSANEIGGDTLKYTIQYLETLQVGKKNYFPDLNKNIEWIKYPFNIERTSIPEVLLHVEEKLMDLASFNRKSSEIYSNFIFMRSRFFSICRH